MQKHSISIRGHRTSISLEQEFWEELRKIAVRREIPIARIITEIDAQRSFDENLSSAIRVHILKLLSADYLNE